MVEDRLVPKGRCRSMSTPSSRRGYVRRGVAEAFSDAGSTPARSIMIHFPSMLLGVAICMVPQILLAIALTVIAVRTPPSQ